MFRRTGTGWPTVATRVAALVALAILALGLPSAAAAGMPVAGVFGGVSVNAVVSPGVARWPWPVAPPIVVSRGFIAPATPYAAGHRGIDLAVGGGLDVRSPADGVVTFAGAVVDRPVITIDVGDELLVSFEPLEPLVSKGARVARGEVVGRVAMGGHCGSVCLHVGVRLRGAYVSPLLFFDRVPRAVLLPLG